MKLNQQQQHLVDCKDPEILAIAGPGSGKTHVLVQRIARMIKGGADAKGIVVITYTNAAAQEISSRLLTPVGYVGTLHGFCLRQINRLMAQKFVIMDEDTTEAQAQRFKDAASYKGTQKDFARALREQRRWWLTGMFKKGRSELRAAARLLAEQKKTGSLDYDSVLWLALRVVRDQAGDIRSERDWHLFVDEAQDSAEVDMLIYRSFPAKSKFIIGDPNQSIFGFRTQCTGSQLLGLADTFTAYGLAESWRCGKEVCDAASSIIMPNYKTGEGEFWYPPEAMEGALKGEVAAVLDCPSTAGEAKVIAEVIGKYGLALDRVAVLVRTNALVDEFGELLTDAGIADVTSRRNTLPDDWSLALAMVGYAARPANDVLCRRVIAGTMGNDAVDVMVKKAGASMCRFHMHAPLRPFASIRDAEEWLSPVSFQLLNTCADYAKKIAEATGRTEWDWDSLRGVMMAPDAADNMEQSGVIVTTIHKAKGREWDAVFLPQLNGSVWRGPEPEQRRLMYVAITRARRFVFITNTEDKRAKPFLLDLGFALPA